MPTLDILLDLTLDDCLYHYEGHAQRVHARTLDGRRVEFPARALRQVVTPEGVCGRFRLHVDGGGRFLAIERLGPLVG